MDRTTITVRTFHWDDLPTLLAIRGPHSTDDSERLRRWLSQPNMRPERDCFIAMDDGRPAGSAYVVTEHAIRRGVLLIDGATGDAEQTLVETAERHAGALGFQVLHFDVPESNHARQQLLAPRGFRHVRTHWHMQLSHTSLLPVRVPDGGTLRLAERADVPALTALQNAAFTGSWGYCPNTPEEIEYRVFDLPLPGPDPVLLLEGEGQLLAYCWDHREASGAGIVGMVGVDPSRRGHGLGRVVTSAGVNYWLERAVSPVEITVDSENTPAVRLYESLGFELDWRSFWYELTVG